MIDNEKDLHKEINDELIKNLHHVDNNLEVLDFMSKFQHLSSINWKWVRSQNPNTKLLLTENVITEKALKLMRMGLNLCIILIIFFG